MVLSKSIQNKKFIEILFIALPISLLFSVILAEFIIFVLIIIFLKISDRDSKISLFKDPLIIFLLLIWIYLIINYLINIEKNPSSLRTIFFLRHVLLIVSVNFYINFFKINLNRIYLYWFFIIIIICGDLFLQFFTKENIFGFEAIEYQNSIYRLGGFMDDELKISYLIYNFGLITFSYIFFNNNNNFKYKNFSYLFLILVIIAIFITGERSIFLSSLVFLLLFNLFAGYKKTNLKLLSLVCVFFIFFGISQKELTSRMIFKVTDHIKLFKYEKEKNFLNKDSHYFAHWSTAYQIFKDNKLFGVGMKNFRNFCDNDKYNENIFPGWQDNKCATHPHNFYFEIISETGIIGFTIITSFFLYTFRKFFKIIRQKKDKFFLFNSFIILIYFIPLLPRGSFFTNWNAIIFWSIFSFLYSNYYRKSKFDD